MKPKAPERFPVLLTMLVVVFLLIACGGAEPDPSVMATVEAQAAVAADALAAAEETAANAQATAAALADSEAGE